MPASNEATRGLIISTSHWVYRGSLEGLCVHWGIWGERDGGGGVSDVSKKEEGGSVVPIWSPIWVLK